ncbi:glycoside hydrolase family 35 protein [Exidia glandulosa HHB12029]|uniref:Beta-galactosidase n=1 Tax=Exidia glandulosa HHB12029 TaxID=1314781 RepID=A0A165GGV2_EXIGL|nr:glycoside hydrolase family 35 protein [Exidia glandulosa HHB12029]
MRHLPDDVPSAHKAAADLEKPGLAPPQRSSSSPDFRRVKLNMRTILGGLASLLLSGALLQTTGRVPSTLKRATSNGLQDIVTWDEYSLLINGERIMIFSGEVHPYRMPSTSLYLDIFQKIKSMGFNAVSFYTFWGMHEPKRGEISFAGFRDLDPFFDAAMEAGIYLIARPGPYINAETTGGGFPGWGTYDPAIWRTSNTSFVDAYQLYMKEMGARIAAAQITNGGPVILFQAENEYTGWASGYFEDFVFEKELLDTIHDTGIVVPTTHNDASPGGHYLSVDLWGYDSYALGFDCSHPTVWSSNAVPESFWSAHMKYTPDKPNAVYEFQGGAFDGWGGSGYETCAQLTGPGFERVFYKNELSMSTTILSLYMTYGGTNWGGIAHPGVYTSYDYGSALAEDRTLRDKFFENKLIASFAHSTPAFLTSRPQNVGNTAGAFTGNSALKTTQTLDVVGNKTGFYTVRHSDSSSFDTQTYQLNVKTSAGTLTIPVLGGSLSLTGKDAKIHVVDYVAGSTQLVYSSAEVMTWATIDGRDVVVLYGDAGELHETAIAFSGTAPTAKVVSGSGTIKQQTVGTGALAIQFKTTGQTVVQVGKTLLFLVDRANAYQFWVLHPPTTGAFARFSTANPILVKGGYFLRTVDISGSTLALRGDLNGTSSFEIIAPAAQSKTVTFNGARLQTKKTAYGTITASKSVSLPAVTVPNLSALTWKTADSLPEISASYSDAKWVVANHTTTVNPTQPTTPVVLFAGDYGFHTGNILWRAHFTSSGGETGFTVNVQGGAAFGYSVWLDSAFIGSWEGNGPTGAKTSTFSFPGGALKSGSAHIITILQDHMGYEEDWTAASETFKAPRGILSYAFVGNTATTVSTWKLTGNLGGEDIVDKDRGPLNEGGLFGERQGWHLPGFDDSKWASGKPTTGIAKPGVSFFRTKFNLNVPAGVDYPIALVTSNATSSPHFRAQFYVNGWQFGKYVNAIGPQKVFPVPQGILNYNGANTLAVSLWAHDSAGAKLDSLSLQVTKKVQSSMAPVKNQAMTAWTKRANAY